MEPNLKLFIAIFTFNRSDLLGKMSESLAMVKGISEESVFVFDDCSCEYGTEFLKEKFPYAESIVIRESNLGADANVYAAMLDFLKTQKENMVIFDSDLLFDEDVIGFIRTSIPVSKGIFSVYNSCIHEPESELKMGENRYLVKKTVGAAGMVISKKVVEAIIKEVPMTRKFDWDICSYLNSKNIPIFVSEKSYVQHVGFSGYNNSCLTKYEYALNFTPNNEITQKHLLISIENMIILENSRKTLSARIYDCLRLTNRFLSIRLMQFLSYIRGGRQ